MKFVSVSPIVLVPLTLIFLTGCGGGSSGGSDDAEPLDDPLTTPTAGNSTTTTDPGSDTNDTDGTEDADGTVAPPTPTTGNQNSNNVISGQFAQVGMIDVEYSPSLNETSLSGFFLSFDRLPVDALEIEENLIGVSDTCVVTNLADIDIDTDLDLDFDRSEDDFSVISAGEVIPFTSQQGSYTELQRSEIAGFTLYTTPGEGAPVAGVPPATLEFSIPGDQFPTFNAIPAQVPDILQVNSPTSTGFGSVTVDTLFRWTAASTSGSRVSISSFGSGFETGVDCIVVDDGEFEFPAETKRELGAFSGFFTTIKRESVSTYRNGNSLLVVTRSNGE